MSKLSFQITFVDIKYKVLYLYYLLKDVSKTENRIYLFVLGISPQTNYLRKIAELTGGLIRILSAWILLVSTFSVTLYRLKLN